MLKSQDHTSITSTFLDAKAFKTLENGLKPEKKKNCIGSATFAQSLNTYFVLPEL